MYLPCTSPVRPPQRLPTDEDPYYVEGSGPPADFMGKITPLVLIILEVEDLERKRECGEALQHKKET